jgi:putative surface-exposed virulence protein
MIDNLMSGNRYNFGADGHNDIDTTNLVDGKPVYYLVGASDRVIDSSSDAGVFYCIDCENVTVRCLTLKNNSYGICFYETNNSRIENSTASDNHYDGIILDSSCNNGHNLLFQ